MANADRLCPECRTRTSDPHCAIHGIATLSTTCNFSEIGPGMTIGGRYRIVRELGRGGHGVVWLAQHAYGLGDVALKVMKSEDLRDEHLIRFHREGTVTAALQHPNTVRVLDFGQTDGGALYLALELLQGRTLEAELREREQTATPMTELEALRLADDLLSGLHAAHAAGLVHRDLKPSNVFLCADPNGQVAKILDFGVVQVAGSDLTASRHAVGSPAYMSPEQCQDGELDGRSDLYALGVVLFRCVAGLLPFRAQNDMALLWAHVHQPAPDVASQARTPLSPAFADAVARALAKVPAQRPATAEAMRRALRGEVPIAHVLELAQQHAEPAQRWPRRLVIAVAVALALPAGWLWHASSTTVATQKRAASAVARKPVIVAAATSTRAPMAAPVVLGLPVTAVTVADNLTPPAALQPARPRRRIVRKPVPMAVPAAPQQPRYRIEDLP